MNLFKQIEKESKKFYKHGEPSHDWSHVERVLQLATYIGRKEKANLKVIKLAAYLHDIGREEEHNSNGKICHAEASARKAKDILTKYKVDPNLIEQITHAIETHRYRSDKKPTTLEGKCLRDADKLDTIGAIGVSRAYLWLGEYGGPLYVPREIWIKFNPKSNIPEHDSFQREWFIKYRYIKNQMLTKTAKTIALRRHRRMEQFLKDLEKEVKGLE